MQIVSTDPVQSMGRRSLLAVILLTAVASVYSQNDLSPLHGCSDAQVNLTIAGLAELEFLGSGDLSGVIRWTLHYDNGSTTELSTCYAEYNCTPPPLPYVTTVIRRQRLGFTYSRATVTSGIDGLPWSKITCSELIGDASVKSHSYRVHFKRITIVGHDREGQLNARINTPIAFSCLFTANSNAVYWKLIANTGQEYDLGYCVNETSCNTTSQTDAFVTTALNRDSMSTRIQMVPRGDDVKSRLSCSILSDGEEDEAILNVFYPADLGAIHFNIVRQNWSATLLCNISRIYSSAGQYELYVKELFQPIIPIQSRFDESADDWSSVSETYILHGPISFQENLTEVKVSELEVYYTGLVFYSWKLPFITSEKWTVKALVCAGTSPDSCTSIPLRLSGFYLPAKPTHNCTTLDYFPETGGSACMCRAACVGYPAGRLMWLQGQVTLDTGEYGDTQLLLTRPPVTRGDLVCRLDWIRAEEVVLPVAYGPDNVDLSILYHYDLHSTNLTITLDCRVTGMRPMTLDMVQWEGPCQGQPGFKCTLNSTLPEAMGKNVTCRVTNRFNNGQSKMAVQQIKPLTIPWNENQTAQRTEKRTEKSCREEIAAVVGLGVTVLVLLVIVLLLLLCRCWYKQSDKASDTVRNKRPSMSNRDVNSMQTGSGNSRSSKSGMNVRQMYLPRYDLWPPHDPSSASSLPHQKTPSSPEWFDRPQEP